MKALARAKLMTKASWWRAMRGTVERWVRVAALSAFAVVAAKVGGEKPDRGVGVGEGETNQVESVVVQSDVRVRQSPIADRGGQEAFGSAGILPAATSRAGRPRAQVISAAAPASHPVARSPQLRQTQTPKHPNNPITQ